LPRLFADRLGVGVQSPEAYQGALAVAVGLLLASALPNMFLRLPTGRRAQAARARLAVREPRKVIKLLIPTVAGALAGGMFAPFVNVFWRVSYRFDDQSIGQIFAASALIITGLGMCAPALSRRWGAVRVMVVTQAVAVGGLVLFGFSPWLALALAGYLGRDVLTNLSRPLSAQFLMDQSAVEERATVSALSTMGFNLAWGVGSWASGIWQTQGQFNLVYGLSAGIFMASAWLLQWLFGSGQSAPAPSTGPAAVPSIAVGMPAE
jgi:predicted MFS family arabinose efflux permease